MSPCDEYGIRIQWKMPHSSFSCQVENPSRLQIVYGHCSVGHGAVYEQFFLRIQTLKIYDRNTVISNNCTFVCYL